MKAISLWQPWASLWLSDRKIHETRHWMTSHRGWMAVHAAKRFEKNIEPGDPLRTILDDEFGGHWAMDLPTGALIGAVQIIACKRTGDIVKGWLANGSKIGKLMELDDYICGDFAEGRYGWERSEYRVLKRPVPYRGQQGIFEVPDDLVSP